MERLSILGTRSIALTSAEIIIQNNSFAEHPKSGRYALAGVISSNSFISLGKSIGIQSLITVDPNRRDIVRDRIVTDSDCIRMSMRAIIGAVCLESGPKTAGSITQNLITTEVSTFEMFGKATADGSLIFAPAGVNAAQVQEITGYRFKNPSLIGNALLPKGGDRAKALAFWKMDFVGQQLLELALVRLVMDGKPEAPASELASACNKLLDTTGFLGEKVSEHPKGPWLNGGAWANFIDVRPQFRAILGALYLDGELDRAQRLVNELFEPLVSID